MLGDNTHRPSPFNRMPHSHSFITINLSLPSPDPRQAYRTHPAQLLRTALSFHVLALTHRCAAGGGKKGSPITGAQNSVLDTPSVTASSRCRR